MIEYVGTLGTWRSYILYHALRLEPFLSVPCRVLSLGWRARSYSMVIVYCRMSSLAAEQIGKQA